MGGVAKRRFGNIYPCHHSLLRLFANIGQDTTIDIEDMAIKYGREEREISTSQLGELVLEKLYTIDKVAYVRFASVYRHFETVEEFIKEVRNITKRGEKNE